MWCTWANIASVGEGWGFINLEGGRHVEFRNIYIGEIYITKKVTDLCDLGGVRGV